MLYECAFASAQYLFYYFMLHARQRWCMCFVVAVFIVRWNQLPCLHNSFYVSLALCVCISRCWSIQVHTYTRKHTQKKRKQRTTHMKNIYILQKEIIMTVETQKKNNHQTGARFLWTIKKNTTTSTPTIYARWRCSERPANLYGHTTGAVYIRSSCGVNGVPNMYIYNITCIAAQ